MILNVDFRCWLPARARFMAAWADQAHAVSVPVLEEEFAELNCTIINRAIEQVNDPASEWYWRAMCYQYRLNSRPP